LTALRNPLDPSFFQELFITRVQGERFSLLTEVVRGIVGKKGLFPAIDKSSDESISDSDKSDYSMDLSKAKTKGKKPMSP
jgi:hypothetical protein